MISRASSGNYSNRVKSDDQQGGALHRALLHRPIRGPAAHSHSHMNYTPLQQTEQDVTHARTRSPNLLHQSLNAAAFSSSPQFFLSAHGDSSARSSAANSPAVSRAASPSPLLYSSAPPSTYSSDTDSDSAGSPLLTAGRLWRREDTRRGWWSLPSNGSPRRRKRPTWGWDIKGAKRGVRKLCRHPFVPRQPVMILLTLLLLTSFGISMTFLIIHILNPDKEPLPWRFFCSIPTNSTSPPSPTLGYYDLTPSHIPANFSQTPSSFPPDDLDSLPPAGVFLGVFSLDSAVERRMLIRSTYASHKLSREGGGDGDGGLGTSRTLLRFILGQPSRDWDRRIQLEMEAYNDIVILPMHENMNGGKSHAYFTWAASHAWVPPPSNNSNSNIFSYSNATSSAPPPARHDPAIAEPRNWVRPDFVAKVDDDAFVMLAELEARLRVQLYDAVRVSSPDWQPRRSELDRASPVDDPLIYWGYLVKNRFMAGELYSLSWSLVNWVADDARVKTMTKGAEDKQTAKWMRSHPRAEEVRWASERCWIYDHPRAGTVYAHGFLFPSEVARVKKFLFATLDPALRKVRESITSQVPQFVADLTKLPSIPPAWTHSSVSKFGSRYSPPLQEMTTWQSVEALVEGSEMSKIREDTPITAEYAWDTREGRNTRYEGKRVGGTVVVHFIKKNMWFLETAMALLHMEETTELERHPTDETDRENQDGTKTLPVSSSGEPDLPAQTNSDLDADLSASSTSASHRETAIKRHRRR